MLSAPSASGHVPTCSATQRVANRTWPAVADGSALEVVAYPERTPAHPSVFSDQHIRSEEWSFLAWGLSERTLCSQLHTEGKHTQSGPGRRESGPPGHLFSKDINSQEMVKRGFED